jgi:hypothetical protein
LLPGGRIGSGLHEKDYCAPGVFIH